MSNKKEPLMEKQILSSKSEESIKFIKTVVKNEFDELLGSITRICQYIENDLKDIYSFLTHGSYKNDDDEDNRYTLGRIVTLLKKKERSSIEPVISEANYEKLQYVAKERGKIVHQIGLTSNRNKDVQEVITEFFKAYTRMKEFKNNLKKIAPVIERLKDKCEHIKEPKKKII